MEPNNQAGPGPMPPLDVTKLQERLATSRTVKRAVRSQCRVQEFRSLPPLLRTLLGGTLTLIVLENLADLALEDYLNEAIHWH